MYTNASTFKKSVLSFAIILASGAAVANEPLAGWGNTSAPVSDGNVTPYIIAKTGQDGQPIFGDRGGNRTCNDVGKAFFGNAEYYRCWTDKQDFEDDGFATDFVNVSDDPECINDIAVTVSEGTYVSFSAGPDGIGAAIIKGGSDANVYVYEPQVLSDSGLASPINASGGPAGLSNIGGFCWNPNPEGDGDEPSCYSDETAWAAGTRYVTKGNWATYTPYTLSPVTLFAGKTMNSGTVTFSAPVNNVVTITVTMNDGWRFALNPVDYDENNEPIYDNNIKVQDYAGTPPKSNPAPGLFSWKTFANGQVGTIEVPQNSLYGIHVDVEQEVACPIVP